MATSQRANRSAADDIFHLLDLLIEQTKLKNLEWSARAHSSDGTPTAFVYRGSGSSVGMESINRDGREPLRFMIADENGKVTQSYVVQPVSKPEEVFFDDRVRDLWGLLSPQRDPISSLIRDLEGLPPF